MGTFNATLCLTGLRAYLICLAAGLPGHVQVNEGLVLSVTTGDEALPALMYLEEIFCRLNTEDFAATVRWPDEDKPYRQV